MFLMKLLVALYLIWK